MSIFGIGAYDKDQYQDVSQEFIQAGIVGIRWEAVDAPELHQFMRSLGIGDIVYIKSYQPNSPKIIVKAIGIITDDQIRTSENSNNLISYGRNVCWIQTQEFCIPKPYEKNNVRTNTMYQEFHPDVQEHIIQHLES
jgi:hypothetical protein